MENRQGSAAQVLLTLVVVSFGVNFTADDKATKNARNDLFIISGYTPAAPATTSPYGLLGTKMV